MKSPLDSRGAPVYYAQVIRGGAYPLTYPKVKFQTALSIVGAESYPMTTITGRIAYDSTLSGSEKSEKRIVLVQPLINFVTKSERFWLTN